MSLKRTGDSMKDALKRLQVSSPYRLSKDGPGLTPPKEPGKEVPQFEGPSSKIPQNEPPQIELAQKELTQNELARSERPQFEVAPKSSMDAGKTATERPQVEGPRKEVPQIEAAQKGLPSTEVAQIEQPQIAAPQSGHARNEATHKGVSQSELAHKEPAQIERPRDEGPRYESPQIEEVAGDSAPTSQAFFRLSPAVFSNSVLRDLPGDCFRLFLWMSSKAWRYPDSTGVIRAAVSIIEQETGMGHATISRGLKALKDVDLVTLIETDFKRGNLWKISPLACAGKSPDPGSGGKRRPQKEMPQFEAPRKQPEGASIRGAGCLNSSEKLPQIEAHLKNYKNIRNLSQNAAAPLLERIEKLSAPKKRETELRHLSDLLVSFSPEDLALAVQYLEEKGTLRGEKCHSPFSYLALAADEVMKRALPKTEVQTVRLAPEPVPFEIEHGVRKQALAEFETELAREAQEEFLEEYTRREFPWGILPPPGVLRSLAASAWFASLHNGNRPAVSLAGLSKRPAA